ncbi:hypothetical protein CEY16_14265 [Halalkalibacillus sediminis]|uniref:DUF58 domain-containing protein n=1 Tax=Halalkalibacillus sediminis TaxID=2018042 RepID=A0A2I0QRJ7_9BACI|nr:DUF58 domain-containing protein [Halalkalibacillus sediminis]PKR76965.1 hypothetical protein CEY16_14265 [Halalkalibacillus sediminis]
MMFRKSVQENNTLQIFVVIGTVILFVSFFVALQYVYILVFLALLVSIVYVLNVFYEKHIDDYLTFSFKRPVIRTHQGDDGYVEVTIEQKGILPILNGLLVLEMDDVVLLKDGQHQKRRFASFVDRPFNLMFWEKRTFRFPFEASKRGVARIRTLELRIPKIFGFGDVYLTSKVNFAQEVVVYPKKSTVPNIELLSPKRMGHHRARHSLFDNQSLPVGTREYQPGDGFNKIHWKASAKEGELQTKVFEKSSQISWRFIINVRSSSHYLAPDNIEELLENVAYMARFASKHNIPYSVFVNIPAINQIPFVHQQEGQGEKHYKRTLELMARMNLFTFSTPYEKLLHFIWKHEAPSAYTIHVGPIDDRQQKYLSQVANKGSEVYYLTPGKLSKGQEVEVKIHG